MGIDVYLKWDKQTKAEQEAQFTGYSVVHGHVGYLREAYHGGPYATRVLISENWDKQPEKGFPIPVAELKKRLPEAVLTALYRDHVVYGERLDTPGHFNLDEASDPKTTLSEQLATMFEEVLTAKRKQDVPEPSKEQVRAIQERINTRQLPDFALAFVDFVNLAEQKEKQTGKPCRVVVSA